MSKLPALVAVCGWVWSFFHVTVAPTGTCRSAGSNVKSPIDTVLDMAMVDAGVAIPVVGATVATGVVVAIVAGVAIVAVVADAAAAAVVAPAAAPVVVDDLESLPHAATASNDSAQLARTMPERFTPVVRCDARSG